MFSWWRARKKKVLINLPFINRTATRVPNTAKAPPKKPITPPKTLTDSVKESPTPLKKQEPAANQTKKTAQLVNINNMVLSSSISINSKAFAEEQDKKDEQGEEIDLNNKPKDNYTHESFLIKWKEFQAILIKKGKVSLATVFEYQPEINNHVIELMVENKALEDEFNHHKPDFIEYIRRNLNNYDINVSTKINKSFKTKKAYTPQEKYEKMIAVNPALSLLKKKLNMEVGYS